MESFTYAATLRNSPMIRKNIEWLEKRKPVIEEPETRPAVKLESLEIETLETPPEDEKSLMELFELMDAE
jgi:hypothetical protein